MKSNIVLIGMPGAGKSTVGVVLAKVLGYDFLDADLLIQSNSGKTLQRLIDSLGPQGFIEVENQVLAHIECERCVVSTGGSAVYSQQAMQHLAEGGTVVHLHVPLESLKQRLGSLQERGVVMKQGMGMSLDDLYAERLPLYQRYADLTFEVGQRDIRQAALALAQVLRESGFVDASEPA